MPAVGHTLARAVYRPLAEQLAAAAAIRAGERVLELSAGDGELTPHLLAAAGASPVVMITPAGTLASADRTFDIAVSLLAIDADPTMRPALDELARVAHRARVVVWAGGATHENALRDALLAPAATSPPVRPPPGWTQTTLADVARFDGITQLWLALVGERGVEMVPPREHAVRERLQERVARFTAADGTMRIPVRATLLSLR
ncbi:MAG TPA: hypothetical protein VG520_05685 [Candidatus Dormibacteraeota bacterium]|nr:hypothetical protein [Candidatus Dormibacteraeota bacterium]